MARSGVFESSLPVGDPDDDPEDLPAEEIDENPEPNGEDTDEQRRIEAEAYRQGWRPADQFRGDPKDFVSAREFVDRGKSFAPFLKKDLDKANNTISTLESQVRALRDELGEVKELARDFRDSAVTAEKRGYDRAMAELRQKARDAVVSGDVAGYDAAQEEMADLEKERPVPKANGEARQAADPPPAPKNQNVDPVAVQFVEDNPWFRTDPVLQAAMNAEHIRLRAEMPGISLAENLERAKETIMARFPQKFGLPDEPRREPRPHNERRRNGVNEPSEPANNGPRRRTGIDTIADPAERAEARRQFERQKNAMPGFTEEQYMRIYNDPRADVLEGKTGQPKERRRNVV